VAKANILKLLKFDEDTREAVATGRRLRNCVLTQPTTISGGEGELCLIGIEEVGGRSGPVFAAATSLKCVRWNQSLKAEMERMSRSARADSEGGRNKLCELLLEQTVWGLAKVSEEKIREVGKVRASQIAMMQALDAALKKLGTNIGRIVVLIDDQKTIAEISYAQMVIANACERSATVAAAQAVARAYRESSTKQINRAVVRQAAATPSTLKSFAPPCDPYIMPSPTVHGVMR
jgi:ribonuclease HII